ncbi:hypothetical protein [Enterovibrio nigricans]|uniref:Uncharacterized protein n=1 Tax=Enterovibrio nigricans DSM 22720 TaxID=1121868 RepID=A0A1T4WA98_9GAMM|nr:hypothetical protein [Enterovibrio nigricans]PKF48770.1 hypothetical protein AT251_23730 [Enterovibrio nigricans]SKA74193.1 hypothetical protein SAMN02745132_04843 [Enterovibrio nigricans DSM 22720]
MSEDIEVRSEGQVVERIESINETLQGILALGHAGIEAYENENKERTKVTLEQAKMDFEIQSKNIQLEDKKHKRVIALIVLSVVCLVSLCLAAFLTNNAQYVDEIIKGVAFLFGGVGLAKLLQAPANLPKIKADE